MKSIYRTILAAAAAIMALNSCVMDNVTPGGEIVNGTDGSRIISISFGPGTKTVLDGFQPKFATGDTIKVFNGVDAPEVRLVKVDAQGNAYFTTDLMGALQAVYPAKAAEAGSDGKSINGISVPNIQSGKFADANICVAEIGDAATTATFENQVAILKFYVDKSIGVKKITINENITVDPEGDATIDEKTDDPQKRICYVAMMPEINSPLYFESETTTQGIVKRLLSNVTLEVNGMYNAFIPYYIDLGKAGKWAYCNIGAFLPEEPGKYFAWGDTEGQTWNGSSWSDEFKTIEGNPDTLKLENDAAHVIWDGSWRMPTKAQLDTLAAATKEWSTEAKGYKLYTASADTSIFLPAAGSSEDMAKVGTSGEYWSSSLNTEEKTLAYKLGICNGSATTATLSRTVGANIRPFRHIPVDSIVLSKIVDTVKIGNDFIDTLIATVYPANASDTLVTWTSSNESVATVDQRGHITGVAGGTATITARIIDLDGTEKSATCEVKVPAKVTDVTLNKTSITALNVGSTEILTATISPSANTIIVSTTWSSDATSIATVDNGTVTGVAPGDATITVTVTDIYNETKTATCAVTVQVPVTALPGTFTVNSSGKKVKFASGNLYYDVTNKKWGVYEKQYEGDNSYNAELMSTFTWGYNATQSIIPDGSHTDNVSVTSGDLSKSQDWGYVFGGDKSEWYTLSAAEWAYLLSWDGSWEYSESIPRQNFNYNNNTRRGKYRNGVTVCGVKRCLVIAPDECLNSYSFDSNKVSYSEDEWATAAAAGVVCLPCKGHRQGGGKDSWYGQFMSWNEYDRYWTSSSNGTDADCVGVGGAVSIDKVWHDLDKTFIMKYTRGAGFHVRLVTDVPTN